jgi:hypothetical protein
MNNISIDKLVTTKKEYQYKLNQVLQKYFIKYMNKLYSELHSYKDFQYELLKISEWSDNKIKKEYNKFLKFTDKKFDLSENELSKILDIIFGINLKIMTSLFNEIELNIPHFNIFWLKCLKRIGKYYYENPKESLSTPNTTILNESIDYMIQKYIPLKDIINSTHKELEYYNFNNIDTTHNSNYSNRSNSNYSNSNHSNHSNKHLDVSLESTQHSLQYIKSEDFENEYYNSDTEKNKDKVSEEKLINIAKYTYPNRKKSFKKKNELDENFFDNL